MRKRAMIESIHGEKFKGLVLELWVKGLSVKDIVDDVRSKHREWSRKKRLKTRVKDIVEEARKKQKNSPSSASSWGTVEDNMQFDMTSESLRATYSKKVVSSEEGGKKGYDVEVQRLGGLKGVLDDVMFKLKFPLLCPELAQGLGVKPISGILLYGPPGCGKTTLAHAIGNEVGVPFYMVSASELVSGVSGESEENIRTLFSKAYRTAPSIIFIDEIEAIASKRDNQQKSMDTRIVTQLLSCMDEKYMLMKQKERDDTGTKHGHVTVIGATNRPDALDPAFRRALRFDEEICLDVPDEKGREEIFSLCTSHLSLEKGFDYGKIARMTSGFVGADLVGFVKKAGFVASKEIVDSRKSRVSSTDVDELMRLPVTEEEMKKLIYTNSHFEEALKTYQPSLTREGFSTIPNVTWDEIGGLEHLREVFYHHVVLPIKDTEKWKGFEFCLETGFLLFGPPGCGKSLVAKAVANEAGANFIHVEGPELLSKFVGDTEKAIRELFRRARMSSPCIIFFDEVDSLTTKRGEQGAWVVERPLNQLLMELDGGKERDGVIVIGATNRPDMMDPAVVRSGRFGKHMYVSLPNSNQRYLILKSLVRNIPIDPSVDLNAIARMKCCENLSGADLSSLVKEAGSAACVDRIRNSTSEGLIKMVHFEEAFTKIKPGLTNEQIREYERVYNKFLGTK